MWVLQTCPTKSTASQSRKASNSLAWLLVCCCIQGDRKREGRGRIPFSSNVWLGWLAFLFFQGESGLGKSTLVNTLFNTQLYPPKENVELTHEVPQTVEIQSTTADLEENGVKLRLTVVDTPGFGDFVNNEDRWGWNQYKKISCKAN